MEPITSFQGAYRWLSNFAPVAVVLDGDTYPTVEHAYQAAKTFDKAERARVRACRTPGEAKRAGLLVTRDAAWDARRLAIMEMLLHQKFTQQPYRRWLLATKGAHITEGNAWHDNFFGNCQCKRCVMTPGQNHLGKLIMAIRSELRRDA